MTIEVHVGALLWIEAENVRVDLAEVDPYLFSVLTLVYLLKLVVIETNFSSVHVEGHQADIWIARCVAKVMLTDRAA